MKPSRRMECTARRGEANGETPSDWFVNTNLYLATANIYNDIYVSQVIERVATPALVNELQE